MEGAENNLRTNPKEEQTEYEAEIKELHAKVGELVEEAERKISHWINKYNTEGPHEQS